MFDGTFLKGDTCNFKVTNPYSSDYNDMMYLRVEYYTRCFPILIKGESLVNPLSMYRVNAGQDYTAPKGINFYLLWQATAESSGDFVFRIWYKSVNGYGEKAPTVVNFEPDPESTPVEETTPTPTPPAEETKP